MPKFNVHYTIATADSRECHVDTVPAANAHEARQEVMGTHKNDNNQVIIRKTKVVKS